MGFKLKTNNRKVESGTTLTAKVVSPDKSAYDYKDFSIIVQPQMLSDKEKVIRDVQTITSILESNNPDWTRITDKIKGINEAVKAASYCTVQYGDATSNEPTTLIDVGDDIINVNTGDVFKRPPYSESKSQTSPGFLATLQISVISGDEIEVIQKPFIVPMWTKEEIIREIGNRWTENKIWEIIKNVNSNKQNIHSQLRIPTALNALKALNLDSLIDTSDSNNIPSLSFTTPSYTLDGDTPTKMINESDGTINSLTASEAYMLERENFNVSGLKTTDLSQELDVLELDGSKSQGEIVLYKFSSKNNEDNKITSEWSYDKGTDEELSYSQNVSNIGFLSQKISITDIKNNIAGSFSLGWFIPVTALSDYNILDSIVGSSAQNNRKNINVESDKHVVLRIANKFSTLVANGSNQVSDLSNIGYYTDSLNTLIGFDDRMFSSIEMSIDTPMHVTTNEISVKDPSDAPTNTAKTKTIVGNGNAVQYAYLNASEAASLVQPINGCITLFFKENSLGIGPNVPVYFSITITEPSSPSS